MDESQKILDLIKDEAQVGTKYPTAYSFKEPTINKKLWRSLLVSSLGLSSSLTSWFLLLLSSSFTSLSAKRAWKADRKALALGSFKKLLRCKGMEQVEERAEGGLQGLGQLLPFEHLILPNLTFLM